MARRRLADPVPRGAWLMWTPPAFLFFFAFFHRVAPGVIAKELMQAFEAGGALVGHLSATYFYGYAALMLPAGILIDAFGVRRVVAAGGAVMSLGTLAMAVAATQPLLFAGRLVVGLGATVTFIGTVKVAAVWFPASRFGTLAALSATVGVVGSLAATGPLAAVASALGWRGAFAVVGLLSLAGALATFLVVRDRPPGAPVEAAPSLAGVLVGTARVLRNPHTWPPFAAFFFAYAAAGNLMLWAVPYLRDIYRLGLTDAAFVAAATSLALLVSAPLTGYLSDRVWGRRKLPYIVLASASCALWALFVATLGRLPLPGVFALLFALGLAGGAFVLTWPIGREVNPPALAGSAVAVVNLGGFLGAALTQGPVGAVLDARWAGAVAGGARVYPLAAYRAAFLICAAFALGSALMALLLRETRGRNVHDELRARRGSAGAPAARVSSGPGSPPSSR